MARIRSIHPGQWTDEDFVACSMAARLLCLALRNEADDQGVFEWKPTTLKMRLMPVDNVDIPALLAELEANNQVRRFEFGGRFYGAIRNFRRYQRPKKPNSIYVLPPELRTYVAIDVKSTEPDDDQDGEGENSTYIYDNNSSTGSEPVPQKAETAPQMEEEGGRRKKNNPPVSADFKAWYAAYPLKKAPKDAERAYEKARKSATAEQLLNGARRYATDPARKPEFTKHPATWLNKGCWLDGVEHGAAPEDKAADDRFQALVRAGYPAAEVAAMNVRALSESEFQAKLAARSKPPIVSRETELPSLAVVEGESSSTPQEPPVSTTPQGERKSPSCADGCDHHPNDPACDFFIPPGNRRAAE